MVNAGELALFGGTPVIAQPFPRYTSLGEEEVKAAADVVRSGCLSGYVGAEGPGFMGGPQIRALEEEAADYFGVAYCRAVNSWTSGLQCIVGSLALEPGDEVITSPWTMAATATAVLHWNAIPVFADIDDQTFNLDPASVESRLSDRTRAILAPDIFGQSADIESLLSICKGHGLKLISDTAQAPGAFRGDSYAGTLSDIGGFSLNHHKHVTCGEGGLVVTNDEDLALRVSLLRNHGEVLLGQGLELVPRYGILGSNYRLGEIEGAIARSQLLKLEERAGSRTDAGDRLNRGLSDLKGLSLPVVERGNTHVYYVYGMVLDAELASARARIVEALRAEGVPSLSTGYQNLHRLPLFANRLSYGSAGFPYAESQSLMTACPTAEQLHDSSFFALTLCAHEFDDSQTTQVVEAFHKVWRHIEALAA